MKIKVNEKERIVSDGITVAELLRHMSIPAEKTLVSVNGEALTLDDFETISFKEGDSVDLFTFVAGG
ncbi:MAG: sulfur carrier protein ThiS [Kiritimatiellaeota bacterium]|nr:sulfur carrier protein ThiS [Kiritimatiellota bacterium]